MQNRVGFSVSLYKAAAILQVQSAIKSGTLNLEHSYKYRPLDAYLIDPRNAGNATKPLLIERGGFAKPSLIRTRCSRNSMRRCTGNTSPRTLTSSTRKNPHIKFKKGGLYGQHPPRWRKAMPRPLQTLLPRARFRPADGGPGHRQSPYTGLDGGISALAAAPSSWPAGRSGRVCRRHRQSACTIGISQDGRGFSPPHQRIGVLRMPSIGSSRWINIKRR